MERVEDLKKYFYNFYTRDLCYPLTRDEWNENNRSFGMCAITALIINDYFGGDICKTYVDNVSHYFNLLNGKIVDLTSEQFNHEIDYTNYEIIDRNKILTEDTTNRYHELKNRLIMSKLM